MKHSEKVYIVKQATLGLGTLAGLLAGGLSSTNDPYGGMIHGAGRGLGFDVGSTLGGMAGATAGLGARSVPLGAILSLLGAAGGGYGGYSYVDKKLDDYKGGAPWDNPKNVPGFLFK